MFNNTYSIDDMPNLKNSMKKYSSERIKYEHDPTPVKRGKNIQNTVLYEMQGRAPYNPFCEVSDIIGGVCRLDHYTTKRRNVPLSQNRMYNILQCMEVINTREIKRMCSFSDRQAQVYLRAASICITMLEKHFKEYGNEMLDENDIGVDIDDYLL